MDGRPKRDGSMETWSAGVTLHLRSGAMPATRMLVYPIFRNAWLPPVECSSGTTVNHAAFRNLHLKKVVNKP